MDIYAPLALVAGLGEQGPPVRPLGLSGQLQMERMRGAGNLWAAQARSLPAWQSCLEAAPAKMSLNKGKGTAPGVCC